ncbi:hypothetical protein BRADI_1g15672v3 [Brachypodium distachyon]|uniref:Uncharacterized protein n=1 Tax=Brachypodium distachyon TaxID=15368 RepID=A0A2K2DJN6_BRADI|nr:hypothetical protein BRADI_1g15672v3 [Brachypodium distachyon]
MLLSTFLCDLLYYTIFDYNLGLQPRDRPAYRGCTTRYQHVTLPRTFTEPTPSRLSSQLQRPNRRHNCQSIPPHKGSC